MNNRRIGFPVLGVLTLALAFPPGSSRAADAATNAPAQAVPSDAPPAPTVPSETPQATAPAAPGSPTSAAPSTAPGERPSDYTVVSGDTLWGISHKFDTSIRELKKLNHLKRNNLKPGRVLKIPGARAEGGPAKTTTLRHRTRSVASQATPLAQPLQDFDVSARGLASGPTTSTPLTETRATPADSAPSFARRIPAPASGSELTYRTPSGPLTLADDSLASAPNTVAALRSSRHSRIVAAHPAAPALAANPPAVAYLMPAPQPAPSPKPVNRGLFNFFYTPPPSVDWGTRFTQVARDLGNRGLEYDEDWCPPGESQAWSMDCSNTARYLYKATTGIQLPRTASDQYYYLHLQNKAWDVPQAANGFADNNFLRANLRAGDLLFWENTYRPERQPPITHVMIFLGTNARGQWMMAGSQSTPGGEHNRRHGGPDIYVFNPNRPCGGYRTWFGLVHHQGRFCAFGRPLEADKSKLAMAAND